MNFKFDNTILLELALKELKITKAEFQKKYFNKLNIKSLQFITEQLTHTNKSRTDLPNEKLFIREKIYANDDCIISTTIHGRIKKIELKKREKNSPQIKYKKKINIRKEQTNA